MRALPIAIGLGLAGLFFAARARAEIPTSSNSTGPEPPAPDDAQRIPLMSAQTPRSAAELDWARDVRYFKRAEFRGATFIGGPVVDLTPMIDARVVLAADELRALLGLPLIVSHVDGAVVRTYGSATSRHYHGDGRLSDALDLFSPQAPLERVFELAASLPAIGGVGLYPHTSPHPLIHVDVRPRGFGGQLATWARDDKGQYVAAAYALPGGVA
jgi:hypothetical protein